MSDLIDFIKARLDEDEAMAKATEGLSWLDDNSEGGYESWIINEHMHLFETRTENARHIARHDPCRVLREVEAKRAIILDLTDRAGRYQFDLDGTWFPKIFALLAAVYSDHRDYRPEWSLH